MIVLTDLTAGFDTIDHKLLIKKFKYYGITWNMIKILESNLKKRY